MMQPVPVESSEKGYDWAVLYNPEVKKTLDIPDGKLLATGAEDRRIRVCHSTSTLNTQTYFRYRYGTLRRGGFNRRSMAASKKSTLSTFHEMGVSSFLAQATKLFEFGPVR